MAKRWYVIHTYSGYENKVKTDLEHRIEIYGLQDKVVDIKIPTELAVLGIDNNQRLIAKCAAHSRELGYDGMAFEQTPIEAWLAAEGADALWPSIAKGLVG